MRRFLLAFIFVISLISKPVQAQSSISMDQLFLKIWPEYDQPGVLVIMDFFIASEVSLPAMVTMKIPAAAGEPHSVAVRELDGQLYILDYDIEEAGDWLNITFTTPYPEIWLEYYDPSIIKDGANRSFTFVWPGEHDIKDFQIEVQQPLTATQMTFEKAMGQALLGSDGLNYYSSSLGDVSAGTSFNLQMSYVKPDDTLSFSSEVSVQPSEPITEQTKGRLPFVQLLPYLLGGLGLVLLAIGFFWYFQNKTISNVAHKRPARKRTMQEVDDEDTIYCHQCGKRASNGDVFCRSCGTKLKIEE
jgi:hypothetical protein